MRIKPFFQVCLLLFVVLGIYYPTLFSGFNTVDDLKLVNRMLNMESFSFWQRLRPGSSFYYRPLLIWTFYLDKQLWGLDASFMHLGNMLLHGANALLVFLIARRACAALLDAVGFLPLTAALVFALHPINTESVNWVSGRTDVLATLFVLLTTLLLIRAMESRRPAWALLAALVFIAGIMSKEVVVFFLPAGCYLLWRWPLSPRAGLFRSLRIRSILCFASPFAFGATVYALSRFSRFGTRDAGFNFVLNNYGYDLFNTVRVVFKVFGFYVKKLFWPMPLNFAITNAHDAYVWWGLAAALVLIGLVLLRRLAADFLAVALVMIAPAIIVALTNVAWTPLAERYLYLSSAFWALAVTIAVYQAGMALGRPALLAAVTAIVLLAGGWVTWQRNLVWQSTLTLYQDTVQKTPNFPPVRNELATALLHAGRHDEAAEQLRQARDQDGGQRVLNVHFNSVLGLIREGDFYGARSALAQLESSTEKPSLKFMEEAVKINEAMLRAFPEPQHKSLTLVELLEAYERLMTRKSDPFLRYRSGQIAMHLGDREKAAGYFSEAYQRAPATAHYREAAGRLAEKMRSVTND